MKLSIFSCLLAGIFSASQVLAHEIGAQHTPFPFLVDDEPAHIEARQNLAQAAPATQAAGQVPPVTIYSIYTQVGQTAIQTLIPYTQTFAAVPDQFPNPKAGSIGYGTLQKQKRDSIPMATPTPLNTVIYVSQPVVLAMETVMITQELQKVTAYTVVRAVTSTQLTTMVTVSGTGQMGSNTLPASLDPEAHRTFATALR